MIYCIEITRELEEMAIDHVDVPFEPTREQVIQMVHDLGYNYDDDYGKLKWYPVTITN